jgi:TonB family protein
MAVGAQVRGWTGVSRRRVPRFEMQAPLDITVLRAGLPDTVPGRSVDVCERGIAAVLAGELVPGETVGVEVRLPEAGALRARAMVRYQDQLRCGLEFVGLSLAQRTAIRDSTKQPKAQAEFEESPALVLETPELEQKEAATSSLIDATLDVTSSSVANSSLTSLGVTSLMGASSGGAVSGGAKSGGAKSGDAAPRPPKKKLRPVWAVVVVGFVVLAAFAAGVFLWRWNRTWEELESGLKSPETASGEKPQAQVAAEVMQKLLVHKVEPVYPAEARKANLQGVIALDIVVGRDGSVVSMHALNGPDVLARAAMDALRWWKFEPYRVNGQPAVVETTLAVEFKK